MDKTSFFNYHGSNLFPFEEQYWRNFYFMDDGLSVSLLLNEHNKPIAHAALKQFPNHDN